MKVLGIDVGGTGIKGAPVDTATGELLEKKFRIDTPRPATPEAFAQTIQTMVDQFGWDGPVGCGFPTVIVNGQTKTFSNLHESWLGINARDLFTKKTGCPFYVLNDAGAAGLAEMKFGAGKDKKGKVIIVTIGTGIGSAFFMNGQLIPNLELGRINSHKGKRIELYASRKTMEDKNLSLEEWAKRFDYFLNHVDDIVSPDHFIVGGGLSKKFEEFKGFLTVNVPIYAAEKRNIAGIVGAALAFELNQKELN